ncbi:hypothetical protein IGI04_019544 [Brassica rapa subsp. trilocularis]|uniref:Uncharacterized protein n=1 Tax=Brassica rapa subsp. trilocularis TaxID=1813537 RepID=A0ABQ7MH12_BRACM|nr:hypothetical protein IGI04_019544 [Brassica rapa subsp. trilocularis]
MAATKMVFQIWIWICRVFKSGRLLGWRTSRRLPGSLLKESSPMSPFHNRYERFGFNQMLLIFHLDMFFRSGFDIHVFQIWIKLWKTYGKSIAKLTSALTRRLPCKSSTARRLTQKSSGRTYLEKKTNFIVSTSEITCLAHKSILQTPRTSNKSDPPRIVSFNGSINHKNFRIKILELRKKECKSIFRCIKRFKLVVHGGWCIDDNDNIVNT